MSKGPILPGYQPAHACSERTSAAFGGDIRKALETAAKDESVKAVVMRVDSPGGSVEASDVILNAARQVKSQKPSDRLDGQRRRQRRLLRRVRRRRHLRR